MADVFLSHSSLDVDLAREVAATLEGQGLTVWWDHHLLSGEPFQQTIQRELAGASAAVVLWTRESAVSEWVYSEARRAHQRGVLVQVRAAGFTIDELPAPFDALHCPSLEDGDALLRAVVALTGAPGQAAPAGRGAAGRAVPAEPAAAHPERKVVTALAVELDPDAAVDPEDYEALAQRLEGAVRAAVERFGGHLEPGGDTSLTAVFGAPLSHEDDPTRAVRAALALLDGLAGVGGGSARVGVATGPALVIGSSVTGQVVPSARRLLSAGLSGAVLVDPVTRTAAPLLDLEERDGGWVAVGVRDRPVQTSDPEHPMVGRQDELAQLQRSFARAVREASVQLVTVVAEPGMGKSRLVSEFADWVAADREASWREGACPPYGAAVATAAVADIVKAQTGVLDSDADDVARQKLEDSVAALVSGTSRADQAPWLVARLSPLLGLSTASAAAPDELHPAWALYLELMAEARPLVVVVEDLHWADRATLDFLGELVEWTVGVPMLLVVTARPELFDRAPSWGAGVRNATTLTLAPLSQSETGELVTSLLDAASLPASLRELVLARAAGNPLYAREYLAMLAGSPESVTPPVSLQALVAARLDTLEGDTKRSLQAAAVLGHTFWTGAVGHLITARSADVEDRLRDLARREFVHRSRSSRIAGESEYAVSHALVADVAYGALPRSDRARFHEAAGAWLSEPVGEASRSGEAALVAHHFSEALRWTSAEQDAVAHGRLTSTAAAWHARAAEQAVTVDAQTALEHVDGALGLTADDDPERARRLLLRGTIESALGREEAALASFTSARSVAEGQAQPTLVGLAQARSASELRALFRADEASAAAADAVQVLETLPPGPELVEAYLELATDRDLAGRPAEALSLTDHALGLLATVPDLPVALRVRARQQRGHYALWFGDPRAREDLTTALAEAEEAQLSSAMSNLHDDLSTLEYFTRSVAASLTHSAAGVAVAERGRHWGVFLFNTGNHVEGLLMAGKVGEALRCCEEASSRLALVDQGQSSVTFQLYWSWALRLGGEEDRAREMSTTAYDLARGGSLDLLASLVLFAAESHPPGMPRHHEIVDALVAAARVPEVVESLQQYLARVARVLVADGDPAQLALLDDLMAQTPTEMRYYHANVASARAELAQARGDVAAAASLHALAATEWRELECPLEETYSLLGQARCRAALGETDTAAVTRAGDLVREMGADGLLPVVAALL